VLKGGLHVLYIEGELRTEPVFLWRSLDASRDIKVDYLRLDPRHKETRPSGLAEMLKPDKYDVYVLGDVDSTAFEPAELEQLKETIDKHGKGLIMLGGFHTYGPGGYATTPLADVLPVIMDRTERQNVNDLTISADLHWPGPLHMAPTPRSAGHFVLALAPEKENAAAWAKLPPLDGANRFAGVKSGAVILAEADGKEDRPLLVSQEFGGGRVIAFAGDTTWRWVMQGFDASHKRFWRQIVLWLAHKDQVNEGEVWVRMDDTRYFPGNRVKFTAGAQSPQNEPIADAEIKARVVKPDNKSADALMLRQDEQTAGSFRETQLPGDYTIEVTATRKGELLGTARARFIVSQQDLELDNASADPDSMKVVARSSGGEVIEPEQLPKWLAELMKKTDYLDVKQETKMTLWDQWPLFLCIVVLLTLEWFLRKRWGLV
jgi:uncharacterized membrane protein